MRLLDGPSCRREGTSQVKSSAAVSRVKVSADGQGVLSHAEVGMLRELADLTELSAQVTGVLADIYRGRWSHTGCGVRRPGGCSITASTPPTWTGCCAPATPAALPQALI